jgi:TetR/AcrR family transcriptional regulator, transcriptional repressor of bet genes
MARPSNTEQRRAQITAALVKVMAKRGYDGASVAEVAKVARLAPGLVHYHFKNKHEILLAVLHELSMQHLLGLEARLVAAAGDARAELSAFIDYHLGLGADADPERLACWILLSGEALRDAKVRNQLEKALDGIQTRLAAVLRAGVEQGVFACERVDVAASALLATIQGYFVLAATARTLIPKGSAALATRQMATGLVQAPAAPALAPKRGRR